MTPRQQRKARTEFWNKAVTDGRVVRWSDATFTAYPTIDARDAALAAADCRDAEVPYPYIVAAPFSNE